MKLSYCWQTAGRKSYSCNMQWHG